MSCLEPLSAGSLNGRLYHLAATPNGSNLSNQADFIESSTFFSPKPPRCDFSSFYGGIQIRLFIAIIILRHAPIKHLNLTSYHCDVMRRLPNFLRRVTNLRTADARKVRESPIKS